MEKMREDFEKEMIAHGYERDEFLPDEETGCYVDQEMAVMWVGFKIGWKASRAALCVKIPKHGEESSFGDYVVFDADAVREILDEAGVSHE